MLVDKTQIGIRIETTDGIVEVDRETALTSSAIKKQISALGDSNDVQKLVINIPNIRSRALIRVLQWCRYVLLCFFS